MVKYYNNRNATDWEPIHRPSSAINIPPPAGGHTQYRGAGQPQSQILNTSSLGFPEPVPEQNNDDSSNLDPVKHVKGFFIMLPLLVSLIITDFAVSFERLKAQFAIL